MLHKAITNRFLHSLEKIEFGDICVTTPDEKSYCYSGPKKGSSANIKIKDWRSVAKFAAKSDIGLAESYRDGWWESDDLTALLQFGMENEKALRSYINVTLLSRISSNFLKVFNRNTIKGSSRNIHHHYDLGNDFYRLWLDPTMSYSAAIFKNDDDLLEEAHQRKYDRILSCLENPRGRLLEIGCGWGGFAERAVQTHDVELKGITISKAQHEYAIERLKGDANIAFEDYRHQSGKYDHIVSIEMFEAVGEQFWGVYFRKMKSLLERNGRAVVQTITIGEQYFDVYRNSGDMIRTFIFPGGMLPSQSRFEEEAKKAKLKVGQKFNFGRDYARTLQRWLCSFDRNIASVRLLGFDDKFIRLWRFYLSICIALFTVGRTDVMQVELEHA